MRNSFKNERYYSRKNFNKNNDKSNTEIRNTRFPRYFMHKNYLEVIKHFKIAGIIFNRSFQNS